MFWLLLALIAAALLAWLRPGGRVAAAVYGLALLLFGLFGGMPLLFALLAAPWVAALLLFGMAPLRQEWLARGLLARFRRTLARLDADTLAQLASASSGWEAELLSGRPDWSGFLSTPNAPPTPSAPHPAPGSESVGGQSVAAARISITTLAWIELLRRHGSPTQQRRWLAPLSRGECRLAGSPQPLAGDGEIIALEDENGTRLALRLRLDAPLPARADLYGLRVWLHDPRRLIGGRLGPSALLLPADTPGLRVEDGVLGATELSVDFEAVIGGIEGIGTGNANWNDAHAFASVATIPKRHAEFAHRVQTVAAARARIHPPLSAATGTQAAAQEALALLAARAGAAQAMIALTRQALARGEPPQAPAAFAASLAAEHRAELVAAAATLGVEAGTADDCFDDAEVSPRLARAQHYTAVVLRGHRAFVRALAAAREAHGAQALEQFDAALREHLGHLAHTAVRALALGLGGGALLTTAAGSDAAQRAAIRRIDRYSAALAFVADLVLSRLGLDLASQRPRTAARARRAAARLTLTTGLGDAAAQLWLASAALKRHAERGAPAEERALLARICDDACRATEDALDGVLRQLASPWLAFVARRLVFPLGRKPRPSDDATRHRLALDSLDADRLRAQLRDASPCCTALAQALEATLAGEPLEAQLAADAAAPRLAIADALAAQRIDAAGAQQLERWLAAVRAAERSASLG